MSSGHLTRQFALIVGGAAIAGMATLSACDSTKSPESPTTPSVPPSQSESVTPPTVSPTEKALSPTGPNSFTPTVNGAPPGSVCREVIGNVCVR